MTTTYAEATTARTAAEILTENLDAAAAEGVNVAGFDTFSPTRAQFEIEARAMAAAEGIRVKLAQAGYLTTAALAGEDFFDEAITFYDLDNGYGGKGRIPATYATWSIPIVCDANNGPYTIATNSHELIAQADDGTLYQSTNVSPVDLPTGTTTFVQFTATTLGTVGNQTPGAIGHLVVAAPGLTISTIVTHVQTVFARDKETTTEATRRALGKWATLGAGWTRDAFDYLIPLFAPTVTRWLVRDDNPNGPGTIEVVLANAGGPSTSDENTAVLAGLGSAAKMTLGTGGLSVISAVTKTVSITGTIYSDGTNQFLLANCINNLQFLARNFPIGGDEDNFLRVALVIEVAMGGEVAAYDTPGFSGAKNFAFGGGYPADEPIAADEVVVFTYGSLVEA
jgi:hypothetical protein